MKGFLAALAVLFVLSACTPVNGNLFQPCDCNDSSGSN